MEILYPRPSVRDLLALIATTVLGACIAGVYGALHDQISYSISPGYFTRMKFEQFGIHDLKAFVVVAYLHDASYAGALAGIVLAIVQVRRSARSGRNAAGISSQP